MRKILLCLFLCHLSHDTTAQANTHTYADSVRTFLAAIHSSFRPFTHSAILDAATVLQDKTDSILFRDGQALGPTKIFPCVYRYAQKGHTDIPTDSICFTEREQEYIKRRMMIPQIALWDADLLPRGTRIVRRKSADSYIRALTLARRMIPDSLYRAYEHDTTIAEHNSAFATYLPLHHNTLFSPGYTRLSNPVFIRNNTMAIVAVIRRSGLRNFWISTFVYRRKNGHWQYYGTMYDMGGTGWQ